MNGLEQALDEINADGQPAPDLAPAWWFLRTLRDAGGTRGQE
jgi:hypothetical protein